MKKAGTYENARAEKEAIYKSRKIKIPSVEVINEEIAADSTWKTFNDYNQLASKLGEDKGVINKVRNAYINFRNNISGAYGNATTEQGAIFDNMTRQEIDNIIENCSRVLGVTETDVGGKSDAVDSEVKNSQRYSFAGIKAKNTDIGKLEEAKSLEKDGLSNEDIYIKTAWFKGADSLWRFEISDDEMKVNPKGFFTNPDVKQKPTTLGDYVQHDKLFEAYPFLKDIETYFDILDYGTLGSYDDKNNTIAINKNLKSDSNYEQLKETLIHEIQHAIQRYEGFAEGSSREYWHNRLYNEFHSKLKADEEKAEKKLNDNTDRHFAFEAFHCYFLYRNGNTNEAEALYNELASDKKYGKYFVEYFEARKDFDRRNLEGYQGLPSEYYLNTAGEIEARDTEGRISLSNEERRNAFPESAKENPDRVFVEGDKYTISFCEKPKSKETKEIINIINENINKLSDGIFDVYYDNNVENYKYKSNYVYDVFVSQGLVANNKELGKVDLSKRGAKSTIMHGFGKTKLSSVRAIKSVIENGKVISVIKNYNNTNVDRIVIAGKGSIDGEDAIVGVVIKSYPTNNSNSKFYLHEAEIIKADSSSMTAPQLSVDTVNKSAIDNNISQPNTSVNTYSTQNSKNNAQTSNADTVDYAENGDGVNNKRFSVAKMDDFDDEKFTEVITFVDKKYKAQPKTKYFYEDYIKNKNKLGAGETFDQSKDLIDFYLKYQEGVANKNNFFIDTIVEFSEINDAPNAKPDFESESGSKYWYTKDGVIRGSNHWGTHIASCDWYIDNEAPRYLNTFQYGFAKWKDFIQKSSIKMIGDKWYLTTFNNTVGVTKDKYGNSIPMIDAEVNNTRYSVSGIDKYDDLDYNDDIKRIKKFQSVFTGDIYDETYSMDSQQYAMLISAIKRGDFFLSTDSNYGRAFADDNYYLFKINGGSIVVLDYVDADDEFTNNDIIEVIFDDDGKGQTRTNSVVQETKRNEHNQGMGNIHNGINNQTPAKNGAYELSYGKSDSERTGNNGKSSRNIESEQENENEIRYSASNLGDEYENREDVSTQTGDEFLEEVMARGDESVVSDAEDDEDGKVSKVWENSLHKKPYEPIQPEVEARKNDFIYEGITNKENELIYSLRMALKIILKNVGKKYFTINTHLLFRMCVFFFNINMNYNK